MNSWLYFINTYQYDMGLFQSHKKHPSNEFHVISSIFKIEIWPYVNEIQTWTDTLWFRVTQIMWYKGLCCTVHYMFPSWCLLNCEQIAIEIPIIYFNITVTLKTPASRPSQRGSNSKTRLNREMHWHRNYGCLVPEIHFVWALFYLICLNSSTSTVYTYDIVVISHNSISFCSLLF